MYPPFTGGSGEFISQIAQASSQDSLQFVVPEASGKELKRGQILANLCLPSSPKLKLFFSCLWANLKIGFCANKEPRYIIYSKILYDAFGSLFFLNRFLKYSIIIHGEEIGNILYHKKQKNILKNWSHIIVYLILIRADSLICNSENTKNLICKLDPKFGQKAHVIYPRISTQEIQLEPRYTPENQTFKSLISKKFILSSGRLKASYKGFDALIKALDKVPKSLGMHLVIAGPGDPTELKRLAHDHDEKRVIFTGLIDSKELLWLYKNCQFFALPGREINGMFEGFGIVFLEAADQEKVFLCGQHGGAKEITEGKAFAKSVNGESIESIAEALIALWVDPKLKEKGKELKIYCEERFGKSSQKAAIDAYLKQIL